MNPDIRALIISYFFLFGVVLIGEWIRSAKNYSSEFTRKIIHIGVGFWGFIAYWLFTSMWAVLIPPVSFIVINLLSYKKALFKSMEIEDKSNLGTIYYPISLFILLTLFWDGTGRYVFVIGLLVMALGDGFASIIGRKWGKHKYCIWSEEKSVEGSAAMFFVSFAAVFSVLALLASLNPMTLLSQSLIIGLFATVIEGISPKGMDNLTVPLISGVGYWIFFL